MKRNRAWPFFPFTCPLRLRLAKLSHSHGLRPQLAWLADATSSDPCLHGLSQHPLSKQVSKQASKQGNGNAFRPPWQWVWTSQTWVGSCPWPCKSARAPWSLCPHISPCSWSSPPCNTPHPATAGLPGGLPLEDVPQVFWSPQHLTKGPVHGRTLKMFKQMDVWIPRISSHFLFLHAVKLSN